MRDKKLFTFGLISASILAAIYIMACFGACQPYRTAWLSTTTVVSARNMTDDGIAEAFNKQVAKCELSHGAKTVAFKACVQGSRSYQVILVWRTIAKPSINSAVHATVTALTLAEKSKVKNLNWLGYLLPAVCAISKIVREYKDLFPEKAKLVLDLFGVSKALTCKD